MQIHNIKPLISANLTFALDHLTSTGMGVSYARTVADDNLNDELALELGEIWGTLNELENRIDTIIADNTEFPD